MAGDSGYHHGDQVGIGRQGRLMRLAGWIDIDSRLTVWFGMFTMYYTDCCWISRWDAPGPY